MPASLSNKNISLSALVGNDVFVPVEPSDYDLLESTVLTSSASSVSFTGLGSYTDYKHLQIRHSSRGDSATTDSALVELNGDTSASYFSHLLFGDGNTVSSTRSLNRNNLVWSLSQRSTGAAGAFGAGVIDFLDAFSSSKNTTMRSFSALADSSSINQIRLASGHYSSIAAVTSIKLIPSVGNFVTGSRFSLYGLKETV